MSTDKLPGNDAELKEALKKLFAEWRRAIKDKDLKGKFIVDGALPGYSKRKPKILLIAQEMHTTQGLKKDPKKRNIVDFVDAFLSGRFMDKNPSGEAYAVKQITADGNDLKCWRLAARIAYSVLQGRKLNSLDELSIESIRKAYKNKFSFAIIEMSKYNNIVKSKKAPGISKKFKNFAEQSLGMGNYSSSKNFIREEIELLNPDLIISWNIKSVIAKRRFNKLLTGNHKQDPKEISCDFLRNRAWVYKFDDGRKIPLFDTYHFSARLDAERYISEPVMRAFSSDVVKKLIEQGKLKERKS